MPMTDAEEREWEEGNDLCVYGVRIHEHQDEQIRVSEVTLTGFLTADHVNDAAITPEL